MSLASIAISGLEAVANLSPTSKSLLNAAVSLGKSDGPGFIAAFKAHDWKTVAIDVVKAELTIAATIPSPIQPEAALALELLPLGVAFVTYAAAHGHNPGEKIDGIVIGADPAGNGNVG